jgi:FkbM family methyltransferase
MLYLKTTAKQMIRIALATYFIRRKSIPAITGPLRGRRLPKHVALQNLSMIFGKYEPHVVDGLFGIPRPINVAYDVGAHIGYMTLMLAHKIGPGGKVFAFEPEYNNTLVMKQMLILNGLQNNICVIPVALTDVSGKEKLIKWKSSSMCLLESALDGQDFKNCSTTTVDTTTLDTFVFAGLNPPPDLLKIDVEGAEALVIQGGLRTLEVYSPRLLMEIHGPKNALKVWELLQNLHYSWSHLTKNGHEVVTSEQRLLSYFSKESWTQHFLLLKLGGLGRA